MEIKIKEKKTDRTNVNNSHYLKSWREKWKNKYEKVEEASMKWKKLKQARFVYLISERQIIIITSRRQHGYPWPSLAISPCRPLLPVGLQGYIPYRHRAAVYRF